MKLAKWHGLGNDYLVLEESELPSLLTPRVIGLLCDRHLGVGSDGILLNCRPTGAVAGAVARMRVFNPDGGEPEMCGNGIRIFARYLARSGAVAAAASRGPSVNDGIELVVETLAGPIKPRILSDGTVRVDMGRARFSSSNIDLRELRHTPGDGGSPVAGRTQSGSSPVGSRSPGGSSSPERPDSDVLDAVINSDGRSWRFTFVDVGNPHCVIFVDDPATFDVAGVGEVIERHPVFPNRVNVEFAHVEEDGSVRMRVWERGVGETQACGTGATAVGAACVRLGVATSPVLVHLLGGDLIIEVGGPERDGHGDGGFPVFMTGPAEEVFSCNLSGDFLRRLGWPATVDH